MKQICMYLMVVSLSVAAAQEFPIAAFHVDDTTWYQGAGEDSLGLNHIWIGGEKRYDSLKIRQLQLADVAGLKGTLYNAVRGDQSSDTLWNSNEIEWYIRLFWTNWEVDSSNFLQYRGTRVRDTQAQGNDAWMVNAEGVPGLMIEGPTRATSTRLATTYDVHFLVKVSSLGADSVRVCSLSVRANGDHKKDSVVSVADFESTNVYKDIVLSYENQANTFIDYGIYWYGTRTLWVDYIETKDGYVQDVVVNGAYNDTLVSIISRYNSCPALEYYYLLDEPDIGNFAANRYIMDFLNTRHYDPGIQTVLYRDSAFYETYIDSVKPDSSALLINSYPLQGDWCEQPTPEDSGVIFQERLDFLCDNLNVARKAAKQDTIPFWFMCQSFGQYIGDSTAYFREPTPRELRCMIWLALAYGAKGIKHFTYKTIPESVWVDSGLT